MPRTSSSRHLAMFRPPWSGWMCESWKLGQTMPAAASITRVLEPIHSSTRPADPAAAIRPPAMATASVHRDAGTEVYTGPRMTRSAEAGDNHASGQDRQARGEGPQGRLRRFADQRLVAADARVLRHPHPALELGDVPAQPADWR